MLLQPWEYLLRIKKLPGWNQALQENPGNRFRVLSRPLQHGELVFHVGELREGC